MENTLIQPLEENQSIQWICDDIQWNTQSSTRNTFNAKTIDTIDDLWNIDIFNDYKLLLNPKYWNNDIYIKEIYQWFSVMLSLKPPCMEDQLVRHWCVQITLLKDSKKIWWLNARIHPQSGKIKFSGLRKIKEDEKNVGEKLINAFLVIAKHLKTQEQTIDYSTTTEQRKIEVCYLLKKCWFQPKSEKNGNKFEIYKNTKWQFCIYTTSTNKIKGDNRHQFIFLTTKPSQPSDYLQFIDEVYIGSWIHYILQEESLSLHNF
jgi:hypothetical protein